MRILIVRGNTQNAKSYPYWDKLIALLKDHEIKELRGLLPEQEIIDLVNRSDVWISIDSFIQHLCAYKKLKPGIVIWSKSDPELFGYKHNTNLLKSRDRLRPDQYGWWVDIKADNNDFVEPKIVAEACYNIQGGRQ